MTSQHRHKGVVWFSIVAQLICVAVAQLPAHLEQFLPRHPGVPQGRSLEPRLPQARAFNVHLPMARAIGTNNYYSQALSLQSTLGKRDQFNKISHKTCRGPDNEEGVCMFVWECIKSDGRHIGMCRDGYMFGSCCRFDKKTNDIKTEKPVKNSNNNLIQGTSSLTKLKPVIDNSNHLKNPVKNSSPVSNSGSWNINNVKDKVKKPILIPVKTTTTTTTAATTTSKPRPIVVGSGTIILSKPFGMVQKPSRPSTSSTLSTTSSTTQVAESMTELPTNQPDLQAAESSTWVRPRPQPVTDKSTTEYVTITHPTPPSPPTRPTRPPKPTKPQRPSASAWWVTKPSKPVTTSTTEVSTTSKPSTASQWNIISRDPSTTTTKQTTTTRRPTTTRRTTITRRPTTITTRRTTPETTTITTTTTTTTELPTTPLTDPPREGPITSNNHTKHATCGVPQMMPQPEGRIVNGTKAKFGEFPWQVSVRKTSFFGFSSTHRCGGALLNEQWVATAGHCVDDLLVSQIRIRVGEYDFSSVQEPSPYIERAAKKKVVHPKYNFFTYEHDLALVQVEEPIQFLPHISPICLPGNSDSLVGEQATLTGWGRLYENGPLPNVLQKATIPIIDNKKCKNMFLKAGRQEYIPEIFLCAGFEHGGRDSCQGDSGGPLQVKGRDGRYFLAGIISWGIGCAEPNLPGVCTRISKFVPWILKNVT